MKFGVSSYSFSQLHKAGKLTLVDTVDLAKELGFDDISFTGLVAETDEEKAALARELRARADAVGLPISSYVVGANLGVEDPTEEIEKLKREVDIAHILGTENFRHDLMWNYATFRSFDLALPTLAAAVREVTQYAKSLGIRTMSENHGLIAQDSDRMERIVAAVNDDNYGLLVDMGNFMCADENPAIAVSRVANLAMMVHAKDFYLTRFEDLKEGMPGFTTRGGNKLTGTVIGRGDVPVAQCLDILRRARYDGYVDIEFEGSEDCIEALKEGLAYLRSH